MPYRFEYANKADTESILPECFHLFYENMREIASLGTYDDEFAAWYSEVCPALRKTPRQIVLMYDTEKFIGFFQYYVRGGELVMEEIQISREYHGSGIFCEFYTWLVEALPRDLEFVRAYTHHSNTRSQGILCHLGLSTSDSSGEFIEFRGEYAKIREKYIM